MCWWGCEKTRDKEDSLAPLGVQRHGGEESCHHLQRWVRNTPAACRSVPFGSGAMDLPFPVKPPRRALCCCSRAGQPAGLCS